MESAANLTRKITSFNEVRRVLRDELALERGVKITLDTALKDLGAEPIYVLNILFRLGVDYTQYTSGEGLNESGRRILSRIAELEGRKGRGEKYSHLYELANSGTTNEFINRLRVGDLMLIKNYGLTA